MTSSDSTPATEPGDGDPVRTARRLELRDGVRHLLQAFSHTASSALNLSAGLAVLCHEAIRTLGAARASAWLHQRRSHELVLAASSGTTAAAEGARLRTDSTLLPAVALRQEGPRFCQRASDPPSGCVTLPLRGRRRALGVLLLEGIDTARAQDADFFAEVDDLASQLSTAVENLLLLEEVLRSRRELTHTFDSLEDLVAVCDPAMRVVHVNRTLADRLGMHREQVLTRPLVDLLGPETAAWIRSGEVADAIKTATTGARELDDPRLGGRFTITVTPLPGGEGRTGGVVFVARDITTEARLEAERSALKARLTQAEKLAALGQFIAGIAHELNNPLQGVLGHIELLRRQGRIPSGIRRELNVVFRESDRAARIVDNLLLFAGGRVASRRTLAINHFVTQVLALRAPAFRAAGIEIERHFDPSQPRISGNRLLLQQAVLNVLLNAEQELTPRSGGRIEVSTHLADNGDTVRLQVRDTGPGIAADALPRLFEPFYTTKDVGRGTGLGLAITYGIIKDHRGVLTADNHPNGGAILTIELPTVKVSPRVPAKPSRKKRG